MLYMEFFAKNASVTLQPRFKENLGELSSPKDSVSGLLDDMVFCRHETERVVSMMDFVPKTTTCQMVSLF